MRGRAIAFGCSLISYVLASAAAAQGLPPAAMVLDVTGQTAPALKARDEISVGTTIALQPTAQITILHYAACSIATIRGGSVSISPSQIDASAENIVSARKGPCPRVHRLSTTASHPSSGAVVMRSLPTPLYLSPEVYFSVTGSGAGEPRSAEVFDEKNETRIAVLTVEGPAVKSAQLLPAGQKYVLRLLLKGRDTALEIPFTVRSEANVSWSIIRIE
ncbi:MAG: hypothetical protein ABI569_15065 [Casimicrobiaceae bacterium]